MAQVLPIPLPPTGGIQYYVYLYENGTWSVGQFPIAPPLGSGINGTFPPSPPTPPCPKEYMRQALISILSNNNLFSNNFNNGRLSY